MTTPRTLTTVRTRLRPLRETDRDLWVRLHTDPAQYPFAPWARSDVARAEELLGAALVHWAEHGFGYGVVEDRGTGDALGVGGVIHGRDRRNLNLYYRLDVPHQGRGLGPEVARAVSADALEHGPALPLTATARPDHRASIRTAERSGFTLAGAAEEGAVLPGVPAVVVERARANDPADVPGPVVLVAPRAEVWRRPFDAETREAVLDLWCATNDSGGAVGFLPGAPRERVAEALAAHEEQMAARTAVAVLLRDPHDAVVAAAWWSAAANPLLGHRRTAYRVMSDPDRRGRNLGRLLMAAMHRVAREDGVEVAELGVRGGTGVDAFYAALGYEEVGRLPGGIRVGADDDRDDVWMARRLDGRPLLS
ncbi:GNAT family N-acetyltransferase [Phycicoccus sonneratiae]|uniref:GNAT family N-acetyltransferase n=1 Tax=Phycicoccus sonneratiae TaxID=2807628 RepID=A0ABS2CIC1_9MICO|nr:GNAT family N-acetyltransferase [Phycicoccus sonneraticus]MBM6398936.1 GNAT family N-acetyltransferase [Phycicoccus sonneraticus]